MASSMNYLKRIAPCFIIRDCNVRILKDPEEFYNCLKNKAGESHNRIILASLYLGITDKEVKLVESVLSSIKNHKQDSYRVHLLFDNTRGSRPVKCTNDDNTYLKSSRTMCIPLLEAGNNNKNVKVSLYHTPNLRGVKEKMLPHRINEVIGLQHMKIYIFDDCLVMSGANLSNDYFTNRQDRYFVFEDSKDLCDYYEDLVNLVGSHSYQLTSKNELDAPTANVDPITGDYGKFVDKFQTDIESFLDQQMMKSQQRNYLLLQPSDNTQTPMMVTSTRETSLSSNTYVFPLIQMGLYNIKQESLVLERLITSLLNQRDDIVVSDQNHIQLSLASGYFNLDQKNEDLILQLANNHNISVNVLTAAPEANGFFKSQGLSYYIPDFYSSVLKQFLHKSCNKPITTYEWIRSKWTFHAKGIWIQNPQHNKQDNKDRVCTTLIGSNNYGYRSRYRDLESELLIHTESNKLQQSLTEERDRLFNNGQLANPRVEFRKISYLVSWLTPVLRWYF